MHLTSVIASLRRQRMMPLLVAVQVALACAILANVLFLLYQQSAPMLVPDGIVRGELLLVDQLVSRKGSWTRSDIQASTQALRALPGVRQVAPAIGLPMLQSMTMTYDLNSKAGVSVTATGFAGEHLVQALGLQLVAGRDFTATDYSPTVFGDDDTATLTPIILTRALAKTLFPDGPALGQVLNDDDAKDKGGYVVVGLVEHLLRNQLGELDDGKAEYSMLLPSRVTGTPILTYAVRTDPQQRAPLRKDIQALLKRTLSGQQMDGIEPRVETYEQLRAEGFRPRRAAVWLLGTVCAVVALITAVGIASLTAYWVEQRTRQIGIRRALGATRRQILRQFQWENLLVAGGGVLFGVPLAIATNLLLMRYYELPRLPWQWLPLGALALVLLGQLAVLWPARRAAAVPPAVATRSA
jgi:putative ABC transport system permease protein